VTATFFSCSWPQTTASRNRRHLIANSLLTTFQHRPYHLFRIPPDGYLPRLRCTEGEQLKDHGDRSPPAAMMVRGTRHAE
jgi:hypothetical protein